MVIRYQAPYTQRVMSDKAFHCASPLANSKNVLENWPLSSKLVGYIIIKVIWAIDFYRFQNKKFVITLLYGMLF